MGDHPRVCKLMAGISNENPPQPKFTQVWDVAVVLKHLEGLEETLSGKLLTLKIVMLIALTSAARSSGIHCLDLEAAEIYEDKMVFTFNRLHKS